jgi:hypothetical protein
VRFSLSIFHFIFFANVITVTVLLLGMTTSEKSGGTALGIGFFFCRYLYFFYFFYFFIFILLLQTNRWRAATSRHTTTNHHTTTTTHTQEQERNQCRPPAPTLGTHQQRRLPNHLPSRSEAGNVPRRPSNPIKRRRKRSEMNRKRTAPPGKLYLYLGTAYYSLLSAPPKKARKHKAWLQQLEPHQGRLFIHLRIT